MIEKIFQQRNNKAQYESPKAEIFLYDEEICIETDIVSTSGLGTANTNADFSTDFDVFI